MRNSPTSRNFAPRPRSNSASRPIAGSPTAKAAFATLSGFGIDGYRLAINGLAARIGVKAKA
jgi:hypothetical protein